MNKLFPIFLIAIILCACFTAVTTRDFIVRASSNEYNVMKLNAGTNLYTNESLSFSVNFTEENLNVIAINYSTSSAATKIITSNNTNEYFYVKTNDLLTIINREPTYQMKVSTTIAYVYNAPISQTLNDINFVQLSIDKDETVTILHTNIYKDANNISFHYVKTANNVFGYMNSLSLINANLGIQPEAFITNAYVSGAQNIFTYTKNNDKYIRSIAINKNTNIKIGEYNPNNKFTFISYRNSSGKIVSTYIETKYIQPNHFTTNQIIGLILLTLSISSLVVIYAYRLKLKKFFI